MEALNNTEFVGRPLKIDEARPQNPEENLAIETDAIFMITKTLLIYS